MKYKINKTIITFIFLWVGFVSAISFMESWLKFRAEGVTRDIGLSIGSIVFSALNKVEITFASIILLILFFRRRYSIDGKYLWKLVIPIFILLLQTLYLLPILDERAKLITQNKTIVDSNAHFFYVALEIIKITTLIITGIQIIRKHEYK